MGKIIDKPELEHEPTWDVAQLFPPQGYWSEAEYLALDTNHLVEFSQASLSTWETVKNTGFLRKTVAENYGRRSQIAKNLGKSAILAC